MAFDRTDPADLAALKDEGFNDPIGMGYNPLGPNNPMVKLFNDPDKNVGGDVVARTFNAAALLDALDPTDYDAQQTATDAAVYVDTLISYDGDISDYKTKFRALFAANSATTQALDAQTMPLSRAEVLFGQGTSITADDWAASRDMA